jgi:hypothetical protein
MVIAQGWEISPIWTSLLAMAFSLKESVREFGVVRFSLHPAFRLHPLSSDFSATSQRS